MTVTCEGEDETDLEYPADRMPPRYATRRCTVGDTAHRAVSLAQLNEFFEFVTQEFSERHLMDTEPRSATCNQRITVDIANMYHTCSSFVLPLTYPTKCAFMELMADAAQPPMWFVSHAWSTVLQCTVAMINWHATSREMEADTAHYWCIA